MIGFRIELAFENASNILMNPAPASSINLACVNITVEFRLSIWTSHDMVVQSLEDFDYLFVEMVK